ncbi:hypothetical protein MHYP_G00138440 [Metynnis hypsauchen]
MKEADYSLKSEDNKWMRSVELHLLDNEQTLSPCGCVYLSLLLWESPPAGYISISAVSVITADAHHFS